MSKYLLKRIPDTAILGSHVPGVDVSVGWDDGAHFLLLWGGQQRLLGGIFHRRLEILILGPLDKNVDFNLMKLSRIFIFTLKCKTNCTACKQQSEIIGKYLPSVVVFLGAVLLGVLDGLAHPLLDQCLKLFHSFIHAFHHGTMIQV